MHYTYHNTSLPNGSCHSIHRPMSRSVSLEYHHQPHRCGYNIHRSPSPLIYSCGNHACSRSINHATIPVPQNGHLEAHFPPPSILCSCIENQCPLCGSMRSNAISVPHQQPATVHAVTYGTHQGKISMLNMHSSPSSRRTKRGPSASRERGVKCKTTNQLSSAAAFQREQLMNSDESDSESEHCNGTNSDQELNQAAVCAEYTISRNKPASSESRKSLESSACKSESEQVTQQMPHSDTTGAGNTATTTNTKLNLHTLAKNRCKN